MEEMKLYAQWIHCIKEKCGEGKNGKCMLGVDLEDFPSNGKCLHPSFVSVTSIDEDCREAFETTQEAGEEVPF